MAIATFGVTYTTVHDYHFPQTANFSTASKPTATTVTGLVEDGAAELAGKMRAEGLAPSTIDGAEATYPEAYRIAARYVRLHAAIACLRAGATADPEVARAWKKELEELRTAIEERGYLAFGDAPAPAQNANGPRTYIAELGLDTGDDADASSAIPTFRKDDLL